MIPRTEHVVSAQIQLGRPQAQALQQDQVEQRTKLQQHELDVLKKLQTIQHVQQPHLQHLSQTPPEHHLTNEEEQKRKKLEHELQQLLRQRDELEHQEEQETTTEKNFLFTAEMLQNALKLVHLNQKKNVNPNFQLLRQSKEISEKTVQKDNAPILIPHPGKS